LKSEGAIAFNFGGSSLKALPRPIYKCASVKFAKTFLTFDQRSHKIQMGLFHL
jgi:hypothetical protein